MNSLSSLVNVYAFSTNRSLFALKVMEQRLVAGGDGLAGLVAEVRRAREVARAVRSLEQGWTGSRGTVLHGGEARRLDAELDRVLGALDGALNSALRAWGAESPFGEAASRVRERLFPEGVSHLIHLPYVEEAEEVAALLERAESEPELVQALDELGLTIYLDRVREVHARYLEALQPQEHVTWDEVLAARRRTHERFCAVVCLLAARRHLAQPGDDEALALDAALQVVWEQNRAVRLARQRRRRPPDVDPDTGVELEDVAQPLALPDFDLRSEDVA